MARFGLDSAGTQETSIEMNRWGGILGFLSVITNHPRACLYSAHASRCRTQRLNLCASMYIYTPCAGLMSEDRCSTGGE